MGPDGEHDKAGKHDNTGKTAKVDKGKAGDCKDKAGIGKTPVSKVDKGGIGKTAGSKGTKIKTADSKDKGVKIGDSKGDKGGKGKIADSKGNKVKTGDSKGNTVKTDDSKGKKIKASDSKDGNDKKKQKTLDASVLGKGQWKQLPPASQLQGGLKLGVDCAGMLPEIFALNELKIPHTVVWATEMDAQKRKVINHLHGDGFPVYMTVLEKNRAKTANCDVLCGGFPCQPFSKVGMNQGFVDKRGTVVFEIIDHIEVCQPRLVILENVQGLVTTHWAEFKDLNEPTTGG
jgi:hypothetical protein